MGSSEAEHEARLDELMFDVGQAVEVFGTDSPEHLAAIDAYENYATAWPGPEPVPYALTSQAKAVPEAEVEVSDPEIDLEP
jgi:hypothetical protein